MANCQRWQELCHIRIQRSPQVSDVTTGTVWEVHAWKKNSEKVSGYDFVAQSLAEVLSGTSSKNKLLATRPVESAAAKTKQEPKQKSADQETSSTITGRVSVILSEAATITDPEKPDYDDMLVAAVGTITQGPHKGQRIKVLTIGMLGRKLQPVLQHWHNGTELILEVNNFDQALKTQPNLSRMDRVDEVEDLLMADHLYYYSHYLTASNHPAPCGRPQKPQNHQLAPFLVPVVSKNLPVWSMSTLQRAMFMNCYRIAPVIMLFSRWSIHRICLQRHDVYRTAQQH